MLRTLRDVSQPMTRDTAGRCEKSPEGCRRGLAKMISTSRCFEDGLHSNSIAPRSMDDHHVDLDHESRRIVVRAGSPKQRPPVGSCGVPHSPLAVGPFRRCAIWAGAPLSRLSVAPSVRYAGPSFGCFAEVRLRVSASFEQIEILHTASWQQLPCLLTRPLGEETIDR